MQLDRKGSTLIMTLALIALVAVMFPILFSYLGTFDRTSAERRKQEDFQNFIDSISMELSEGVACSRALSGSPQINPSLLNIPQALVVNTSYGGVAGPLRAGWKNPVAGVEIEKVEIILKNRSTSPLGGPRTVTHDWPPFLGVLNRYEAEIIFTPLNLSWRNDNVPERRIKTFVNLLGSGATARIIYCYGPNSAAEACEAMGGAYDARPSGDGSPQQYRCNPDLICFNSNQGLVSSAAACSLPYQGNAVGNFNPGGAKYLCTWCNRNK